MGDGLREMLPQENFGFFMYEFSTFCLLRRQNIDKIKDPINAKQECSVTSCITVSTAKPYALAKVTQREVEG